MELEKVLELLAGVEMEDEQRGIISDSITELHDGLTAGAQAKIAQIEAERDEALKANEALKAQNYDLIVASTSEVEEPKTEEDTEHEANKAIDELFTDKED